MREFQLAVLLATLFFPVVLFAQHGSAENGYYPIAYHGDTWTGTVSSFDPRTNDISLVYNHKGKTVVFDGILSKAVRFQSNGDKQQQTLVRAIYIGAHLRVFYIPNQTSDELGGTSYFKAYANNLLEESRDAKLRFNLIFLLEFLPEEGETRTGTVISTNDSTREITLVVTDGTQAGNFIGVVIDGYRVRMKDGSLRDLVVSQIPVGTKMIVHYFDEMTGAKRTTGEVHRIYQIQFPDLPQN